MITMYQILSWLGSSSRIHNREVCQLIDTEIPIVQNLISWLNHRIASFRFFVRFVQITKFYSWDIFSPLPLTIVMSGLYLEFYQPNNARKLIEELIYRMFNFLRSTTTYLLDMFLTEFLLMAGSFFCFEADMSYDLLMMLVNSQTAVCYCTLQSTKVLLFGIKICKYTVWHWIDDEFDMRHFGRSLWVYRNQNL